MPDDPGHPLRLSAFLDGELPAEGRARTERHLATCPACRSELAALAGLRDALGGAPAPLPPGLATRLRARTLARRAPLAPLWWAWLPPAWRLALAVLLVAAAAGGHALGRAVAAAPSATQALAASFAAPELAALATQSELDGGVGQPPSDGERQP